jgi:hypothetical protein
MRRLAAVITGTLAFIIAVIASYLFADICIEEHSKVRKSSHFHVATFGNRYIDGSTRGRDILRSEYYAFCRNRAFALE